MCVPLVENTILTEKIKPNFKVNWNYTFGKSRRQTFLFILKY